MAAILDFLPTILLTVVLVTIVFMGLHVWSDSDKPIRRAVGSLLLVLLIPVQEGALATGHAVAWLWGHVSAAFRSDDPETGRWAGWIVIGAVFTAAVVLTNIYAEWWLLVMALPILGYAIAPFAMPQEAATITALAFVSLGVFWGGMLTEALRITTVTPWSRRRSWDRSILGALSLVVLVAILWASGEIGVVRGLELSAGTGTADMMSSLDPYAMGTDALDPATLAPPPPDALDEQYRHLTRTLPIQINALLAVAAALTFMAGKWSLTHSAVYASGLGFYLVWLTLWPVHFLLATGAKVVVAMRDDLVPDFARLAHLGLNAFSETLRDIRDDLFTRHRPPATEDVEDAFADLATVVREAAAPPNPNGAAPKAHA